MATNEELSWPSVGRFVSAYEENLMAADSERPATLAWPQLEHSRTVDAKDHGCCGDRARHLRDSTRSTPTVDAKKGSESS